MFIESKMCITAIFIVITVLATSSNAYKCVKCSGGGIFFWWQAGAAAHMQENLDLKKLPIVGASAGSITAALLTANVDFKKAAELAIDIAHENKVWDAKFGLLGIWGPMIKEFLDELIPDDITPEEMEKLYIAVTPRLVVRGAKYLNKFESKDDMINAIMTSIHIPLFMNGRLFNSYKGKKYIDGSFWSFVLGKEGKLPGEFVLDRDLDILHVDYGRDIDFVQQLESKSIVNLITPDMLYEMMDYGYKYMDTQMQAGTFPDSLILPRGKNGNDLLVV